MIRLVAGRTAAAQPGGGGEGRACPAAPERSPLREMQSGRTPGTGCRPRGDDGRSEEAFCGAGVKLAMGPPYECYETDNKCYRLAP